MICLRLLEVSLNSGSDSHLLLFKMMLLLVHRRTRHAATISTGEARSVNPTEFA